METPKSRTRDAVALTFASLFPLVMAYLYFVVLADPDSTSNPAFQAAIGAGKGIQFLFPLVYVWWFEREQIRFKPPTWRGLPLGVAFALAVGIAMFVLYFAWVQHIPAVATETPQKIHEKVQAIGIHSPGGFLQMAIGICVIHSLFEEYYWRWFVFGWMRRYLPGVLAIALSSIGFMLHHVVILAVYFPGNFWTLALPFSVCVAVGGGVWAWLYERSGALHAPWLSHCLIDAAIMGLGYVMLEPYWR